MLNLGIIWDALLCHLRELASPVFAFFLWQAVFVISDKFADEPQVEDVANVLEVLAVSFVANFGLNVSGAWPGEVH